jgi:hypothetical protein
MNISDKIALFWTIWSTVEATLTCLHIRLISTRVTSFCDDTSKSVGTDPLKGYIQALYFAEKFSDAKHAHFS